MTNKDLIDSILADARAKLISAFPEPVVVVPVELPPPPVPTPSAIVLQNMELVGGEYRSVGLGINQKCYAQIRVSQPPKTYAKLSVERNWNVVLDGKLNLKFMRVWPNDSYPDDYVARSLNTGAEQFTTENPTKSSYFLFPNKLGVWMKEVYEFDYANKRFVLTVDGKQVAAIENWDYGTLNRTQFGVQCVCANPTSTAKLPSNAYCNFRNLTLEVK